MLVMAASFGLLTMVSASTGFAIPAVALGLLGLGAGLAMPAAVGALMSTIPPDKAGVGSALNDTIQQAGSALGIAISRNLVTFGLSEAELEIVKAGLTDGALQKEPKVDLQAYGPKIQELQQTRAAATAATEKKASQRRNRTNTPPSGPPSQNASTGSPAGRVGSGACCTHPQFSMTTTTSTTRILS